MVICLRELFNNTSHILYRSYFSSCNRRTKRTMDLCRTRLIHDCTYIIHIHTGTWHYNKRFSSVF